MPVAGGLTRALPSAVLLPGSRTVAMRIRGFRRGFCSSSGAPLLTAQIIYHRTSHTRQELPRRTVAPPRCPPTTRDDCLRHWPALAGTAHWQWCAGQQPACQLSVVMGMSRARLRTERTPARCCNCRRSAIGAGDRTRQHGRTPNRHARRLRPRPTTRITLSVLDKLRVAGLHSGRRRGRACTAHGLRGCFAYAVFAFAGQVARQYPTTVFDMNADAVAQHAADWGSSPAPRCVCRRKAPCPSHPCASTPLLHDRRPRRELGGAAEHADVIVTCLPNTKDSRSVAEALAPSLKPGQVPLR